MKDVLVFIIYSDFGIVGSYSNDLREFGTTKDLIS
jgi:hypothetical protein